MDENSIGEFMEMSVSPIVNTHARLMGKGDVPVNLQMVAEPDMKYGKKDIRFKTVDGEIISLSQIAQWLGIEKEAKKTVKKKSSPARRKRR